MYLTKNYKTWKVSNSEYTKWPAQKLTPGPDLPLAFSERAGGGLRLKIKIFLETLFFFGQKAWFSLILKQNDQFLRKNLKVPRAPYLLNLVLTDPISCILEASEQYGCFNGAVHCLTKKTWEEKLKTTKGTTDRNNLRSVQSLPRQPGRHSLFPLLSQI